MDGSLPIGAEAAFSTDPFLSALQRRNPELHINLELVTPWCDPVPSDQSAVIVAVAIPPQDLPVGTHLCLEIGGNYMRPARRHFHGAEEAMARYRRFAEDRSLLADVLMRHVCSVARDVSIDEALKTYNRILKFGPSILWKPLLLPPRADFSGRAFVMPPSPRANMWHMKEQAPLSGVRVHVTMMLSRDVA